MRITTSRERAEALAWWKLALDVDPNARRPGRGVQAPGYGQQTPGQNPAAQDAPWMKNDWRGATDGGAFHSSVRPPLSSNVPHPSEAGLHPKRNARLIDQAANTKDPVNDPWGVLNGTGHTFEDLVNNHVDHFQHMTPEQDYAGRVWYRSAHDLTKDVANKTHGDHGRVVSTYSAFSPRKAWDENIEHGTHFAANYDGSNPDFTMPTLDDQVDKAKRIYHGENPHDVLGGPKTKAFTNNISDPSDFRAPRPGVPDDNGYYDHPVNPHTGEADWRMNPNQDSTVDTHHARMQTTPHGADLSQAVYATPEHFDRNNGLSVGGKELDLGYDLHDRASWEATRRINEAQQDPMRHQIPMQTQAGPWGKFKDDVDAAGRGSGSVAPGERPKGLQERFDMKKNRDRDPADVEREWSQNPKNQLKNPIPRYQQDPDDWKDQRRPQVAPQSDWMHKRNLPQRQYALHTALIHGGVWDRWLQSWIAQHPQNAGEATQGHMAHLASYHYADEFDDLMQGQSFGHQLPTGPHENPWSGADADELRQTCPYCQAGPGDEHDIRCPTNHTDDPREWAQDTHAIGPGGHFNPGPEHDPMRRTNHVLAYSQSVLDDGSDELWLL